MITLLLVLTLWGGGYHHCGEYKPCDTTTTTVTEDTSTTTTMGQSTSTSPETSTTTSTPEPSSTTSVVVTTSTTLASSTTLTTTITPISTTWSASSVCDRITAEFGEGIAQVDVWMRDEFGDFGPADGLVPITSSGQELETGVTGEWVLVPVVVNGYEAVPEEIHLFTERCVSTSVSPTSSTPTDGTLPFTGVDNGLLAGLGASVLALGALLLYAVRREEA